MGDSLTKPQVRGTGIKVKLERHARCAHSDLTKVLDVIVVIRHRDTTDAIGRGRIGRGRSRTVGVVLCQDLLNRVLGIRLVVLVLCQRNVDFFTVRSCFCRKDEDSKSDTRRNQREFHGWKKEGKEVFFLFWDKDENNSKQDPIIYIGFELNMHWTCLCAQAFFFSKEK